MLIHILNCRLLLTPSDDGHDHDNGCEQPIIEFPILHAVSYFPASGVQGKTSPLIFVMDYVSSRFRGPFQKRGRYLWSFRLCQNPAFLFYSVQVLDGIRSEVIALFCFLNRLR